MPDPELLAELMPPELSPVDPDTDPEYLIDRRALLGPSADFTHPEFGLRENRPEENYRIEYEVVHPDDSPYRVHLIQRIYDHNDRLLFIGHDYDSL